MAIQNNISKCINTFNKPGTLFGDRKIPSWKIPSGKTPSGKIPSGKTPIVENSQWENSHSGKFPVTF